MKTTDAAELLDGQQRASAIHLGFYNPLGQTNEDSNGKIFKTSYENIMIFIDLAKPNPENDNRKYLFRVITNSHPWGYRRQENQKTLASEQISKAMDAYILKNYDYLKNPLTVFWPYDSYEPIPLGLFIHAANSSQNFSDTKAIEILNKSIEMWKGKKLKEKENKLEVLGKKNDNFFGGFYKIDDIYKSVKIMLENQKIPLLFLDMQKIYGFEENSVSITQKETINTNQNDTPEADNNTNSENEQTNIEDRSVDEVENLFIRLNSGGTPLRGEELNYSVLKAHISLDDQNAIEATCKDLFYPARFITIAFRLFNSFDKRSLNDKDFISMKIKPKQFQRNIKEKNKEFIRFITDYFINNDIIPRINNILTYHKDNNPEGLPLYIVNTLADKAPEIMFLFLYRLLLKKDLIDSGLKVKVIGMITLFVWLGKGDRLKDHSKLLNNIWLCVRDFDTNKFWSNETIQRAMLVDDNGNETLTPFPNLKKLQNIIPKKETDIRNLTWSKICAPNTAYGKFISKIFYNKDLLLYAQRSSLSEWFHEIESYNLEDTNRAFDWDHISPINSIRNKKHINQGLKDWYYSNGNIRAWPYSLNREDQDVSPDKKFNPNDEEKIKWWKEYFEHSEHRKHKKIKDNLLELSFCDSEWIEINDDIKKSIRENWAAKKIIHCILERNMQICKEWYERLKINELYFKSPAMKDVNELFKSVFDNRMWEPKREEDGRLTYYLSVGVEGLYVFISYGIDDNTLNEDEILFGIGRYFDKENREQKLTVKMSEEFKDRYMQIEPSYIFNNFTLVSYSVDSIMNLFNDFYIWIVNFPDKFICENVTSRFRDSITTEYKRKVINEVLSN